MGLLRRMLVAGGVVPFALHAAPAGATPFANFEPDWAYWDIVRKNGEVAVCKSEAGISWQEDDVTGEYVPGPLSVESYLFDGLQQSDDPFHCEADAKVELFWGDVNGNRFMSSATYRAGATGSGGQTLLTVAPAGTDVAVVRITFTFSDCDAAVNACTVTHVFAHK